MSTTSWRTARSGSGALAALLDELPPARRAQALTHRAWAPRRAASYERLELLGDSVLALVVTVELMRRHPDASEGDLAWMRQGLVNGEVCAAVGGAAGLGARIVAQAPVEDRDRARDVARRESVLAAVAEAVIGGAWLDLGAERTGAAVLEAFGEPLARARPGARDPKTTLQELAARRRLEVAYELTGSEGPPHRRTFASRALVGGREVGVGRGPSKQASEAAAAAEALDRIAREP